jgi:hypothetical protein
MGKPKFEVISPEFKEGAAVVTVESTVAGRDRLRVQTGTMITVMDPVMAEELADALDQAIEWREKVRAG